MAQMISLLVLAFAVSLDSFSVGFTYGLRKMKIPIKSIIIIATCSAVSLLVASGIGKVLTEFLSPKLTDQFGGLILIVLGAWVLYQFFRPEKNKELITIEKTWNCDKYLKKTNVSRF
jgi:putative sporulation protein YtaF